MPPLDLGLGLMIGHSPAPAFSPTSLPGLVFLGIADTVTQTSNDLSAWNDLSGSGHSFTLGTGSGNVVWVQGGAAWNNSQPLVRFASANPSILVGSQSDWIGGTALSLAAIFSTTTASSRAIIVGKDYNAAEFSLEIQSGLLNVGSGGSFSESNGSLNDGVGRCCVGTYDGAHLRLYVSGVLQTNQTALTGATTGTDWTAIGAAVQANQGSPLLKMDMDCSLIAIAKQTWTQAQITQLQTWAHTKYGV